MGGFRSTKLPSCNAGPFSLLPATPTAIVAEQSQEDMGCDRPDKECLDDKLLELGHAHSNKKQSKHQ